MVNIAKTKREIILYSNFKTTLIISAFIIPYSLVKEQYLAPSFFLENIQNHPMGLHEMYSYGTLCLTVSMILYPNEK